MAIAATRPPALPSEQAILGRAGQENFPVAARLLPPQVRADLLAIYGWARLVDQLGDAYPGDRLGALDWVEAELDRARRNPGRADLHPLVRAAAATVGRLGAGSGPLLDLVEANRLDQRQVRYATFTDLVGYCRLSAVPVGRLVLAVFRVATPERQAWADRICIGLQLAEHWQDLAEDAAAGRQYVPDEDLERFGVDPVDLLSTPGRSGVPALLAFEVSRARHELDAGTPLIATLTGRPRWTVAGFVAGGHAALDAVARSGGGFDPRAGDARPRPTRFARHLARLLRSARVAP